MNKQEALDVINALKITEMDGDGETLFYALVDNTEDNREVLLEIGVTQEDIENATSSDKESIDLTCFVWQFADWNNGDEFVLEKPLDDM